MQDTTSCYSPFSDSNEISLTTSMLGPKAKRIRKRSRHQALLNTRYCADSDDDDNDDNDLGWDPETEIFEDRESLMQLKLTVGENAKSLEGLIFDHLAEQTCLGEKFLLWGITFLNVDFASQKNGRKDVRLCREFGQAPPVMTFTFHHPNGTYQGNGVLTIPDM